MGIPIGTVSYATAAVVFFLFFLLLVTSWRGRLQGMLFAVASFCTAIWACASAYLAMAPLAAAPVAEFLEVLRSASWFAFLVVLLGYTGKKVRSLRRTAIGIASFCCAVLVTTLYSGAGPAAQDDMFRILSRLLLAIIGMVLVEQIYRNVNPQQRWGIKYLCLGLGGIFVCDFYLYSDALLFRRVSEDIWAARGVVNALVVPLLAVATARNPKWSLDIFVSRGILFHSTAMLGSAAYLLVMAAAGYYIRYFGGNWGAVLQVTFLFGAVLLLLLVVFSGTLRARLKVYLSKNFFSYRYDYREEWLRFTNALSVGEPGNIRLPECSIEAIANLVDSPGGALWLSRESGAFEQIARWNMQPCGGVEQPEGALCQFLEKSQWVIDLEEYEARPGFYAELKLPDWLRSIPGAWLVVPLILHERLIGFIVLARSKGKINLNWEVNDLLKTAGRQAASYLAQLESARALLVARQFESFNRMSAFVMHDLKNVVAQLSLMMSNADKHKHKPEFQEDMIDTVSNSVDKIKRLMSQLREGYTLAPPEPVELRDLLRRAASSRSEFRPAPRLEDGVDAITVLAHRTRLDRVIGNLVQNAIDATAPEGQVTLKLSRENSQAVITIADSGCGMSEQFIRDRLFKPFESTKAAGMGIGAYESEQYVRERGGRMMVQSIEGKGTVFRVTLPIHVAEGANEPGAELEVQK